MYLHKDLTDLFIIPLFQDRNCNLKCMEQRRKNRESNKQL